MVQTILHFRFLQVILNRKNKFYIKMNLEKHWKQFNIVGFNVNN